MIHKKFKIPLLYELEIERGCTHRWMQIAKSKNVIDIGLMEERLFEMGKELVDVKLREFFMKEQLQSENMGLKEKIQETDTQLATMATLCMEAM